ncbi:platelet-derived growth factor receptor beta-like isoform X2 [Gouania willdenowi]|uniref:platelet-derived growth factor receptor beta-like isoform X2 n=1 Tax=Gouania willdenowi TaxID=441366 RepID=UPI001054FDEF|nr:platelet-derived growth factor receptor beta-like isoform X2 [Gouania willdenowi]
MAPAGEHLHLIHFLFGVLLVGPEDTMSLEVVPSATEVLLDVNSNYTVVCSGWSPVTWEFPGDSLSDSVIMETQGSVSVLQFVNVTWKNSGRYTCEEKSSKESKDIDIFIPGQGPEEWFVPLGPGVVMKEAEEETIPCVVSDPHLNVSLFERGEQTAVVGMKFEPGRGFTGRLNDTSYICVATRGQMERQSQVYYVFSVIVSVPKQIDVELSVSSTVVKKGEVLTVNCTVTNTEMVFFTWDFPRKQEVEPVTDFLPNQIRSFVNITSVTMEDSGVYLCVVQETTEGPTMEKNITVRVLDQGFVSVWPSGETNTVCLLHHSVEFTVEVEAHPEPSVVWTKDNLTIPMETISTNTKHLTGTRYSSTLSLVRVLMDQRGRYTVTASNEDMEAEVTFTLEVQVPPKITSLSELSTNTILCASEGAPPPSVKWYICPSSLRCSDLSGGWMNLSATTVGITQQDTVTVVEMDVAKVRSVLALQAFSLVSAVRCEVNNSAGRGSRDLRMESVSLLSQVSVLAVVLVLFIIALIFLIILIVLWRKKPGYEVHWKLIESASPDGQSYVYVDPAKLPYSSDWEIPRDQLVLGQVLGSGAFGRVVEGTVSGLMESQAFTKVAVKMVKGKGDAVQSLMSELRMLVHVGPHLNLVNVLGASTTGGPVYLITEFCCHGDLLKYLQRNKNSFLLLETHSVSDGDGGYMDMKNIHDVEPHADEMLEQRELPLPDSDSSHLSLHDLLWFSYQVCHAMDFLSVRQCVHTDLAARNVLVCEKKLVKVCDYGLARDLLKHEDYDTHGNAVLPLRWMSPESIFQKVYSSHSQVWSFGVLLWEIFSMGCRPYAELMGTRDLFNFLRKGHRMSRPEHASQNMYELMMQCWKDTPQSRPSFSSLVDSLASMLSDDYKQRYCQLTQDFHRGQNPAIARSQVTQSKTEESVETGPSHSTQVIDVAIETISTAALDAVSVQDKEEESSL